MKRPHKYGAKAVVIDGIRFPSKKQGNRYCELKLLARAGEIKNLQLEVDFPFRFGGEEHFIYRADFVYYDPRQMKNIIEDVKGFRTEVYKLKKKLIEAQYCFKIVEV